MGSPAALGSGALGGWQQRPRKGQQLPTTWRGQPVGQSEEQSPRLLHRHCPIREVTLLIRQASQVLDSAP